MRQMMKSLTAALVVIAIMLVILAIETWRTARKGTPGLNDKGTAFLMLAAAGLTLLLAVAVSHVAHARDLGQWDAQDPALKEWYQSLMRPDAPTSSCCGEADAYWADEFHVRDGKTYATITDDRPDAPRGRPHVENGSVFEVPPEKLKWDRSNPTGHGVLFLSRQGYVFCYVQPGGA
jgi:hypothetical protein